MAGIGCRRPSQLQRYFMFCLYEILFTFIHTNANHSQSPRNSTLSCTSTSAACASSTCSRTRPSSSWSSEILALRSVLSLAPFLVALSNLLESAVVLLDRAQSARDVALPAVVGARSLHNTALKNLNSPQARLERVCALCFRALFLFLHIFKYRCKQHFVRVLQLLFFIDFVFGE